MLEGLTTRLRQDIDIFRRVIDAHDHARSLYDQPPTDPDSWANVRSSDLPKTAWHIYDHCAAFTHLYAIYGTYVEELIEEYLRILPTLYPTYDQLPSAITNQHRLGLGIILGKIGEGGVYNNLGEIEVITTLSHGLTGGTPYKLIKQAFLTDRQNYRLDILGRILGYLGIEHGTQELSKDAALTRFLENTKPEATTVQSELEQFIKRRNEAAHSHVTEVVATDEIKRTADFIGYLGEALAALFRHAILTRQYTLGQLPKLGMVEEVHHGGFVIISHFEQCMIRSGDRLAFAHAGKLLLATVVGLQLNNLDQELLLLTTSEEVGIKCDRKIRRGAAIHALREQQTAPCQLLQVVERRKDDVIQLITDNFRSLTFITNDQPAMLDSIDSIELDTPKVRAIGDDHADLALTAHVDFTAVVTNQNTGIEESGEKVVVEEATGETVQGTVTVVAECRMRFADIASLTDTQNVTFELGQINNNDKIVFAPEPTEAVQ
jgi:hypothetical protein